MSAFPLGIVRYRPGRDVLWIFDAQVNQGVAIFGFTGSGKTTTEDHFSLYAMREAMPQVVIDAKSDMAHAQRLREWASAHGRPFLHWTAQGPDSWNPLATGTPTELKDKLVGLTHWSEDHYRYAAERFLQAVFAALAETGSATSIVDLVPKLGNPSALTSLLRQLRQQVFAFVIDVTQTVKSLSDEIQALRRVSVSNA